MKDHYRTLGHSVTILVREQITRDHFNPSRTASVGGDGLDPAGCARGSGKTAQIAIATIHQVRYQSRPDETGCTSDEDKIVLPYDKVVLFRMIHIL
jgi:hypothetical protein